MKYTAYILAICIFLVSCVNNQHKICYLLKDYFDTENVATEVIEDKILITIKDSKLIYRKQKKLGNQWINAESWVSVAAINVFNKNIEKDSICFKIFVNAEMESYCYSNSDLASTKHYIDISKEFIRKFNRGTFTDIKGYLGTNITKLTSDQELESGLSSAFPKDKITEIEFIGMKIENGINTIYLNIYYNKVPQTYMFSYIIGSDKIEGIKVP